MAVGPVDSVRERVQVAARPLAAFGATTAGGVIGFVLLTGVSVVDAAFWLVDPTSIELYFEHHQGPERATKAFSVVVFTALVLAGLWVGESALDAAFDGRLQEGFKRMQTERTIADLSDHVVICGYGMFGRTVADGLRDRGWDVVVVENDADKRDRMDDEALVVGGDARRESVLRDAGVDRAGMVVAAIDDSSANIQIAVTADDMAPTAQLVVRVGDEMYESTARHAGADVVVIPEVVSGVDVVEGF